MRKPKRTKSAAIRHHTKRSRQTDEPITEAKARYLWNLRRKYRWENWRFRVVSWDEARKA